MGSRSKPNVEVAMSEVNAASSGAQPEALRRSWEPWRWQHLGPENQNSEHKLNQARFFFVWLAHPPVPKTWPNEQFMCRGQRRTLTLMTRIELSGLKRTRRKWIGIAGEAKACDSNVKLSISISR